MKDVCGYDSESHQYKTPSLALKFGHSLKACATYLRVEGIKEGDDQKKLKGDTFLELYKANWEETITSKAFGTIRQKKYKKPKLLPLVKDVVKLQKYLRSKSQELCKQIEVNHHEQEEGDSEVKDVYTELAKVCLAQVILFNQKRSGEAERMTVKDFLEAQVNKVTDPVVLSTLTEFEKELCASHIHIDIEGKRDRMVPVILTQEMKTPISVLLRYRTHVNVSQGYIFGRPGAAEHPYSLRRFAKEYGATHPTLLTSTNLRKQLATLEQILSLSDNSQDLLATFQGHDIRVHRAFYMLPESTLQVPKVAKLLHSINNDTIGDYKGKDFDEIEFEEKGLFKP